MGLRWIMNKEFAPLKGEEKREGNYIMNLDINNNGGTHWVNIFVDNGSKILFYMDPFGSELLNGKPPLSVKSYAKKNNLKIVTNKMTIQAINSNFCGYYSIFFGLMMNKLYSKYGYISEKMMNKELKKYFDDWPDNKNARKIIAFSKEKGLLI
jgi:hypothetical protein